MTYLWFRGSRVRPGVAAALLLLRRACCRLARPCASRGACWPAVECLVRSQLPDCGKVGARSGRSFEPQRGAISAVAYTIPSPRSRGARGQGSGHELQEKNARTEGKRATRNEKTPPIFINARKTNCFKKSASKYKKEAKSRRPRPAPS